MITPSDITIVFSQESVKRSYYDNRHWEEYAVYAYLLEEYSKGNKDPAGYLNITRALNFTGDFVQNALLFNMAKKLPVPKPYVNYQFTDEHYRGLGLSGALIVSANDFYKEHLGTNLHSDYSFCREFNLSPRNPSSTPAKRVWQKLELQGLAKHIPCYDKNNKRRDRWVML
jgi:hypothetical protein